MGTTKLTYFYLQQQSLTAQFSILFFTARGKQSKEKVIVFISHWISAGNNEIQLFAPRLEIIYSKHKMTHFLDRRFIELFTPRSE